MEAPRVYRMEAVVLRQRRLGDADKILTLFTPGRGRIEAVAKGVRRIRSRLAGHLEPLTYCSLLLARGRSLDIVTQAQTLDGFADLRGDLERLSRGLYAAEIVDRLTEEWEDALLLFRLLVSTLTRLAGGSPPDAVLRYFEMQMLDILGYRPRLDECTACGRRLEARANHYSAAAGGALCAACLPAEGAVVERLSVNGLKYLRLLQRGGFGEVERLRLPDDTAFEVERHLRASIGFALEREVRSARFLDRLRRMAPAR